MPENLRTARHYEKKAPGRYSITPIGRAQMIESMLLILDGQGVIQPNIVAQIGPDHC